MLHLARAKIQPTMFEKLHGFEKVDNGHIFKPTRSNVRVIISGRDWDNKALMIYGSTSTKDAETYIEEISSCLKSIDHGFELLMKPEIRNLAVSGSFEDKIHLESLYESLRDSPFGAEYEPEQFPALMLYLDDPDCTFLLYSSGRFIIQGLRERSDVQIVVEMVEELLL